MTATDVDAVLLRYGLTRIGEPWFVPQSVLNANYRVETDAGPVLVRFHRDKGDLDRLELEARAMEWCADRGIAVPLPLCDLEGNRFVRAGGRFTSVYPWVDGRHLQRAALREDGAAALGDVEGRLQAALRDFSPDGLRANAMGLAWDREQALDVLRRVNELIHEHPVPEEERLQVPEQVRFQLELLETEGLPRPVEEFAWLARRPVFGDYHTRNVLFEHDSLGLAGVIDWEMVCLQPPLYEVLRAIQFSRATPEESEAWVRAYARHIRLPAEECRASVDLRWQGTLHDTWALREVFIQSEAGPAQFLSDTHDILVQWSDPAYRQWLADLLVEHVAP